ncbi:MAG: low-specificity L-threonine aldolase [Myxococcota bacterium]
MIDLRSDTVTRPTDAMRRAMMHAAVGDDVYGEDPTVNRLEELAAERLGFDAAVFVPSGTQSNLIALMSHCERGDEFLVGHAAHTYKYEGGGAAVLGSIQPQPLSMRADGSISLKLIEQAIKPDDPHFARTRLLCLENTHHGRILPLDFIDEATSLAGDYGLATHLDGARIFNAAVATDTAASEIAEHFDSVSVCLSKGLGAPVGTVLCGSTNLIDTARRWKKVTGGGWRQAGILAAAGVWALEHHVERLQDDHRHARELARGLEPINGIDIEVPETNMVWVDLPPETLSKLCAFLEQRGIMVSGRDRLRLVTHLDVSDDDVQRVIRAFDVFFQGV